MRYIAGSSIPLSVTVAVDGVQVMPASIGITILGPQSPASGYGSSSQIYDGTVVVNNAAMTQIQAPGEYQYIYSSPNNAPPGVYRMFTTVVGTDGTTISETSYAFEIVIGLVVENGSGLWNADAYVTVEDADTYAAERGNNAGANAGLWLTAAYGDKASAIRIATRWIDSTFSFIGYLMVMVPPQALKWPRLNAYDEDYKLYQGVPQLIQDATCEMAISHLFDGPINAVDYNPNPNVYGVSAGGVSIQMATRYGPIHTVRALYQYVKLMLSPLTTGGGIQLIRS